MADRSQMKRGPYMSEEKYNRMKSLANSKGMSVQDCFEELIDSTVSSTGNITANTVKVRFGSSSKPVHSGNKKIEYSDSVNKGVSRIGQNHIEEFSDQVDGELVSAVEHTTGDVEIFITKYRVAVDLAYRGYTVKTDLELSDNDVHIYAYDSDKEDDINSLAIQIGNLELDDVGGLMNEVDVLMRVPKGGQLTDAISVQRSNFRHCEVAKSVDHAKFENKTPSSVKEIGHIIYINSEGEQFVPRLDLIMVESLRDVAEHMVTNYNSYDQIDAKEVAKDIDVDNTTERDVKSVLEHLGFKV